MHACWYTIYILLYYYTYSTIQYSHSRQQVRGTCGAYQVSLSDILSIYVLPTYLFTYLFIYLFALFKILRSERENILSYQLLLYLFTYPTQLSLMYTYVSLSQKAMYNRCVQCIVYYIYMAAVYFLSSFPIGTQLSSYVCTYIYQAEFIIRIQDLHSYMYILCYYVLSYVHATYSLKFNLIQHFQKSQQTELNISHQSVILSASQPASYKKQVACSMYI